MKDDVPFLSWLTDLTIVIFNEEFVQKAQNGENKESDITIDKDIIPGDFPEKIKPEKDIWKEIFNEIHEIKTKRSEEEEQIQVELEAIETEEEKEAKVEKEKRKKLEKKKIKKEKREAFKRKLFNKLKEPKNKIIFGVSIVIVAAGIFYLINILSASSWEAISEKGIPKIESVELVGIERMNPGFTLVTNNNSKAAIKIPYLGKIVINEGTLIKRLPSGNALMLEKGSIIASKGNAKKLLTVEVPSAEIQDYYLGGYYKLSLDEAGNSLLHVNDGWEIVKGEANESFVPAGFYCEIRKDEGVGIPFSQNTSDNMKSALRVFSFENKNEEILDLILNEAQTEDAISLWHLFKRIDFESRPKVFNVLYGLVQPPKGVSQEGILKLKNSMLQTWLEEIELAM